jgi:hypothetical protein
VSQNSESLSDSESEFSTGATPVFSGLSESESEFSTGATPREEKKEKRKKKTKVA